MERGGGARMQDCFTVGVCGESGGMQEKFEN